jgi:hypothetical protein
MTLLLPIRPSSPKAVTNTRWQVILRLAHVWLARPRVGVSTPTLCQAQMMIQPASMTRRFEKSFGYKNKLPACRATTRRERHPGHRYLRHTLVETLADWNVDGIVTLFTVHCTQISTKRTVRVIISFPLSNHSDQEKDNKPCWRENN